MEAWRQDEARQTWLDGWRDGSGGPLASPHNYVNIASWNSSSKADKRKNDNKMKEKRTDKMNLSIILQTSHVLLKRGM